VSSFRLASITRPITNQKRKATMRILHLVLFVTAVCPGLTWAPILHQKIQRTVLLAGKFSQPAFSQSAHSRRPAPPPVKEEEGRRIAGDSKIGVEHERRLKTAGRVGTKRYVNPCKVFFGNLAFNVTKESLQTWICQEMALPPAILLNEVKVVKDWKTNESKGYGFCVFTEPHHATIAIDKCNGKPLQGRALRVDQGQKKKTTEVYVKKKKEKPVDADEEAILAGIEIAEEEQMDPVEMAVYRKLDPDLLDDKPDEVWVEDDDEDDSSMNRERRRAAARLKKKKKPPSKGFGVTP
jgi:RNA recognition motif-containing protein